MANNLYFSRDTKLYAVFDGVAWELPILDGFGFSQANNSSEITLAEMESTVGVSRRGRRLFNDSLAPAEFNFSTYVRPFASAGGGDYQSNFIHAVEELLWAQMAGADTYDAANDKFTSSKFTGDVTVSDATDLNIDYSQSNRSVLATMDLFFVMETNPAEPVVYKLEGAVVNEATIDFDVDGIATVSWSGFAKQVIDWTANTTVGATFVSTGVGNVFLESDNDNAFYLDDGASGVQAIDEGVSDAEFIRNRLTQLEITAQDSATFPGSGGGVYSMTLTGGSITVTNNINYLTPEEIGKVNIPLENVTGARSVSGSFTCYINYIDAGNAGSSTDFFNAFQSQAALDIVTNQFTMAFKIGGATGPRLEVAMPEAHVEIPVTSIEDVISLETSFHGLPSTISDTDEVNLTYFAS